MSSSLETPSLPLYADEYVQLEPTTLSLYHFYPWLGRDKTLPLDSIKKIREVRLAYYNGLTWHEKAWLDLRWPHDWRVKGRKEGFLLIVEGFFLPIGVTCREPQALGGALRKVLPDRF